MKNIKKGDKGIVYSGVQEQSEWIVIDTATIHEYDKLLEYDDLSIVCNILYIVDKAPTKTGSKIEKNLMKIISHDKIKTIVAEYADLLTEEYGYLFDI